jgi:histidinol-phosphate phosphatase family protein
MASVRAQIGNRDDALMRRKHGSGWRNAVGGNPGRLRWHVVTAGSAALALASVIARRPRIGAAGGVAWLALTLDFAVRRIIAGPRTVREVIAMLVSSILISPAAVAQRLYGTWLFRSARPDPPLAVLFDRDDTLIEDGPYLNDPEGVVPKADARRALGRLREHGLLLGVVTNQSGIAKGLISDDQLKAVNARVDELLGPFDSWQICVHDVDDECECRKPLPGMVIAAAGALGVDTRRCVLIGDTGGDVAAAQAANAEAILVPTNRTRREEIAEARCGARVAGSLDVAVSLVLGGLG